MNSKPEIQKEHSIIKRKCLITWHISVQTKRGYGIIIPDVNRDVARQAAKLRAEIVQGFFCKFSQVNPVVS
jgi:hypothetical protein